MGKTDLDLLRATCGKLVGGLCAYEFERWVVGRDNLCVTERVLKDNGGMRIAVRVYSAIFAEVETCGGFNGVDLGSAVHVYLTGCYGENLVFERIALAVEYL